MSLTIDPSANSSQVAQALYLMQNGSPTGEALLSGLQNSSIDFHIAVTNNPGYAGVYDPTTHTLEISQDDLNNMGELVQDIAHEASHANQDAQLGLVDTSTGSLEWGSEALFGVSPSDIGVDTSQYSNNELNFGEMFAEQDQEKVANELGYTFTGPQWNADGSHMTQQQFDAAVSNIEQQVAGLYADQGSDMQYDDSSAFYDDYARDDYDNPDGYW
jgi:hypothetical protein